jgi:hypothetical protein
VVTRVASIVQVAETLTATNSAIPLPLSPGPNQHAATRVMCHPPPFPGPTDTYSVPPGMSRSVPNLGSKPVGNCFVLPGTAEATMLNLWSCHPEKSVLPVR